MSALAAMAGGLGFWLLAHAVSQYRFASRVEQAVEVGGMLFNAADRLSAVIPTVGELMFSEKAADAAGMQRVADARRGFEEAAEQVQARIAALSGPGAAQQFAIIREVRASRLPWDARAEALLVRPRNERDLLFWEQYIIGYDPTFDALDSVLDLGDMAAEHEDGLTMDLLDLARQSWLTRVLMADRSGPVVARVGAGQPLDSATLERVAQANGRLAMRWMTIDVLARRLPRLAGLGEVIAAAHATAGSFDAETGDVVDAGRRGGVYPVAVRAFGEHSVAVGKSLVKIRDVALRAALSRASEMRQAAAVSVATVALVMLLIAAGTIAVLGPC